MNLIKRIRIKLTTLWEFNLFQRFGFPIVKQEKISKSIIKKYLPDQPIIIDCGAHDGADSEELLMILGGQIHAFEPVNAIYQRLRTRVSKNENIHCYKLALSDQTGIQTFYVSEGNLMHQVLYLNQKII
ncbi:MAG: FkbM family methyltransferase [Saprospiraceae bacterium]|nr:FkbM family methyltransferase [Saprospiraceae bacterium]